MSIFANRHLLTLPGRPTGRGERGIALVLVLWLTLILAMTAAAVVRLSQSNVKIAANVLASAQAEALADGGVYLAISALMRDATEDPWPIDGSERSVGIGAGQVTVAIYDESQKLDLNLASAEDLRSVLAAVIGDSGRADEIVADIMAARAIWANARPTDAHVEQLYLRGRLHTIGDLRNLVGGDVDLYRALRQYLTVYGGRRSPGTAVPHPADGTQPHSQTNVYAILTRAATPSGVTFSRYAVVSLPGGGAARFDILHWD